MGELGLLILEKAYGRFDTGRPASLDKLQFTQVLPGTSHVIAGLYVAYKYQDCSIRTAELPPHQGSLHLPENTPCLSKHTLSIVCHVILITNCTKCCLGKVFQALDCML